MAGIAKGSAAEERGASDFMLWHLGRHAGAHPSRALCRDPRAGSTQSEPDGCDHRQPERQGGSKRGSALDPQGFDAGKKVIGRKRHILGNTLGLLLNVVVHSADVQDRNGGAARSRSTHPMPLIAGIFADAGLSGTTHCRERLAAPVVGCWRSSSAMNCTNSSSCPGAGSSNELWPGSAAITAWRAISSATPTPSLPSSGSR